MLDIILLPKGEQAHVFDVGIGLDREQPMQTALGLVTPVTVVPTIKGPPHTGPSGWLFHLDAPNLLLSRLIPDGLEKREGLSDLHREDDREAITARMLECAGHSGPAEFRCVRNPRRAVILDANGCFLNEANINGDTVYLDVSASVLMHVQIEF
jgi:hypothetical protein